MVGCDNCIADLTNILFDNIDPDENIFNGLCGGLQTNKKSEIVAVDRFNNN